MPCCAGSSERRFPEEQELYDLRHDPAELTNVVDDAHYQDVLAQMRAELARLQAHDEDEPHQGPDTRRLEGSTGVQQFSGTS